MSIQAIIILETKKVSIFVRVNKYFFQILSQYDLHFLVHIIGLLITYSSYYILTLIYKQTMQAGQPESSQAEDGKIFSPSQLRFSIHNAKSPTDKIQAVPKNSIDQGILQSLGTELKSICYKFSYVLLPRSQSDTDYHSRSWDLWGPFLMCLIFAFFVDNSTTFMVLIFSVFVGGVIVTFNIKVLGGKISYFQSVSILGYCICPIFVALLVVQLLKFFQIKSSLIRFFLIIASTIWAIFAARSFIGISVPEDKKFVGLYPIVVFYFFIAILMIFR